MHHLNHAVLFRFIKIKPQKIRFCLNMNLFEANINKTILLKSHD